MRTWKSLFAVSLLLGGAAACGDDEGGHDHDANVPPDAEVPGIDATPMATVGGTMAIADIEVTTPDGAAAGLSGGAISIEFSDLTMGGGEVIFGTSPIGGCVVQRFDADGTPNAPNPPIGAGAVTLTGDGLLKPVGPCNYAQGAGYLCASDAGTVDDVSVSLGVMGSATYQLAGEDFTGVDLEGAYLVINGLTNASNNSGASAFPIVRQLDVQGDSLVVINPAAAAEALTDGATFTILNGVGPIPTAFGGDSDFLGDETTEVTVTKPADANFAAIDFTTYTRGEGFDLDDASDLPHQFPAAGTAMDFSCAGAGGDCGAEGTAALEAIIISGRTTDTTIPAAPPTYPGYLMPAPTTEYATFQCGYLLADSGSIPAGAVDAILSTNPTRIEVRVLRVAGTIATDGLNETRVLVGHGLVGHTTITPP